jgi:hypothetical protein
LKNHPDDCFERVCPECGNGFTTYYKWQKFCNPNCQVINNKSSYYNSHKKPEYTDRRLQAYVVVRDPDTEYGLLPGLMLSNDDIREGLRHGAFSEGLELKHRRNKIIYRVENKDLRMV